MTDTVEVQVSELTNSQAWRVVEYFKTDYAYNVQFMDDVHTQPADKVVRRWVGDTVRVPRELVEPDT